MVDTLLKMWADKASNGSPDFFKDVFVFALSHPYLFRDNKAELHEIFARYLKAHVKIRKIKALREMANKYMAVA